MSVWDLKGKRTSISVCETPISFAVKNVPTILRSEDEVMYSQ